MWIPFVMPRSLVNVLDLVEPNWARAAICTGQFAPGWRTQTCWCKWKQSVSIVSQKIKCVQTPCFFLSNRKLLQQLSVGTFLISSNACQLYRPKERIPFSIFMEKLQGPCKNHNVAILSFHTGLRAAWKRAFDLDWVEPHKGCQIWTQTFG